MPPLHGLRISKVGAHAVVETGSTILCGGVGRRRRRKGEQGRGPSAGLIGVGVGRPQRDAEEIVGQLSQRRLREDAKTCTEHRLGIAKGAEGDAETRIVIVPIVVAQALRKMVLARGKDV